MALQYEWDEAKRLFTLEGRGIDFASVEDFEWDSALVLPSDRYGETRLAAIGYIRNRLYTVIYTERGDLIRVISMRKSSRKEIREYAQT